MVLTALAPLAWPSAAEEAGETGGWFAAIAPQRAIALGQSSRRAHGGFSGCLGQPAPVLGGTGGRGAPAIPRGSMTPPNPKQKSSGVSLGLCGICAKWWR